MIGRKCKWERALPWTPMICRHVGSTVDVFLVMWLSYNQSQWSKSCWLWRNLIPIICVCMCILDLLLNPNMHKWNFMFPWGYWHSSILRQEFKYLVVPFCLEIVIHFWDIWYDTIWYIQYCQFRCHRPSSNSDTYSGTLKTLFKVPAITPSWFCREGWRL